MSKLKGKVAIVTGATSGIGEATAKLFAAEGAKVAVVGRNQERGEEVVKAVKDTNGEALFVQTDMTNNEEIKNCVSKVLDTYGTIDILFNSAGIHDAYHNAIETDEEAWDKLMNVNVKGPFLMSKAVLPTLLEKGKGTIINVGSQGSFVAGPGVAAYVTSKHALVGFTRQLAYDFGSEGIKANLIAPGFIDTKMTEGIDDPRLKDIPAERAGKPEEVAAVALFLASDESDYIQGTEIKIDGGWTVGR